MASIANWTGQAACALQFAMRETQEGFAARLGVGLRTVASWHERPDMTLKSAMQGILDTALQRASDEEKQRFAELTGGSTRSDLTLAQAERRVDTEPNNAALFEWLDRHAQWTPGTARRKVIDRLVSLDTEELHQRRQRRSQVKQAEVADPPRIEQLRDELPPPVPKPNPEDKKTHGRWIDGSGRTGEITSGKDGRRPTVVKVDGAS